MISARRLFGTLFALLLLVGVVGHVAAQGGDQLVLGQPLAADITTAGQTVSFAYPLSEARAVTIQALSQGAQPTLTVLRGSEVIAQQPNVEGALSISLLAYLPAGEYAVEVGAANGGTGSIIVLVQSELSILPIALNASSPIQSAVSVQSPLAVYTFNALPEPAYLYVDSLAGAEGLIVRVRNLTSGRVSAEAGPQTLGARLTLPAGDAAYQLEIAHSGATLDHSFNVCLTAVSVNACAPAVVQPVPPVEPVQPTQPAVPAVCALTPAQQGGVNIRASADVNAPILFVLPNGAFATVTGVSPDSAWYQVNFANATGWVAASVVAVSGDCSAVPVIAPPVVATLPPVVPTVMPTDMPPAPTMAPAPTLSPTPSGPCLVTFSAPELVYTRPDAIPDWIYDQVPAMGEIVPVGRYDMDGSWYKTNYADAWWHNTMGTAGTMTGDCSSLPLVSWP